MARLPAGTSNEREGSPLRVGVSSCLLGNKVRYDGGHKRDGFLVDVLGPFVTYVAVCPEMELGWGAPRDPVRLEKNPHGVRFVSPDSGRDWTGPAEAYSRKRVESLLAQDLCGFVLKKGSPSCGMERVKVYRPGGGFEKTGRGVFAAALLDADPLLPVEEEGRLEDPRLRENFLERVFAYRRLKDLFSPGWRPADLVAFHTREKFLLLAHDTEGYRALGRCVAGVSKNQGEARRAYSVKYMDTLKKLATRGKHANVLQHMAGFLKTVLDSMEKQELGEVIEDSRRGWVPLVVPLTLLRHHVRRHGVAYLQGQSYLEPHPKELMLRNHV